MSDLDDLDEAYAQAQPPVPEPLIPAGDYIARAVSVGLRTSAKGTHGLRIGLAIEEGPSAGRMLHDDLWLTGGALPISKQNLTTLGFENLKPSEIACYRAFDRLPQVIVRVRHERHEERTYPAISSYRRRVSTHGTGDFSEART